jgi:phosphohistidine swiveling domain-containing protein
MIYSFTSKETPILSQVGGKAKALTETTQAGFNVPEGFVLSVDFFRAWIDGIKSTDLWRGFLQAPNREACVALQERAKQFRFTPEQRAAIEQHLSQMPQNVVFAVRSSSPEEDLAQTSFAGQYETFLGVKLPELEKNIAQAFSSMLDFRVVEYKRQNGLPIDNPRIAIIVQKQIESDVSGIAFSLNPNNNAFDEAMINASFGLGEAIVSGRVTPDTYVVDKVKKVILEKKVAHKPLGIWLEEDGGIVEKPNPTPESQALTDAQILEVAALAANCEQHYGKPMDTEWAIEGGRLYLLQSRPITTYNPLFPEMITQPGERKNLYVDLNILSQGFFDPVSELGLDIWSRALPVAKGGTFPKGFDGAFFDVGGREYIHISNMANGIKASFNEISNYDMEIREVFKSLDIEHEYIAPAKTEKMKKSAWATLPFLIGMIPSMIGGIINPNKATSECEQSLAATYRYCKQDLLKEGAFDEMVERGVVEFGKTVVSIGGVDLSVRLARRNLEKLFKDQGVDELVGLLSAASPTNPTAQMGRKMLELASFAELQDTATEDEFVQRLANGDYSKAFMDAYNDYMERFGARGFKEIDIAAPRVTENPRAFFRQLKALNITQNNERDLQERKQAAYQQLLELARKRGKEKQFVSVAQRYMVQFGFRESPKYLFVVMIGELRKRALELGQQFVSQGRLASPEQIFDLTVDQASEAETDPGLDLQSLREKNLAPRQAVAHIIDWPKIVDSRGKIFRYVRPSETGDLAGEAISPGVVRGKAKVLASPYEKPLETGEVLVTRATEPAWTPVFINAAGVVLEIGGPLQHGAIIAREYNLPCVSGINRVTKLIKDGDLLEVDGTSGLVKIIQENDLRTV